jgi:hypothetical protein
MQRQLGTKCKLLNLESTPKSYFTPKLAKGDFCKLPTIKHSSAKDGPEG